MLFEILRNEGVLLKDNTPYQKFVDSGYFKVVETTVERNGQILVFCTTYIKQRGLDYIRKLLLNKGFVSRKEIEDYWSKEDLKVIKENLSEEDKF